MKPETQSALFIICLIIAGILTAYVLYKRKADCEVRGGQMTAHDGCFINGRFNQ